VVEHSLGKGEVESSILSGSTIQPTDFARSPCYAGAFTHSSVTNQVTKAVPAMPAKIRHLHCRDGRYFARVVVPKRLRKALGAIELRQPLGADRREAVRTLSSAIARFRDRLADAERQIVGQVARQNIRPMGVDELAKAHFDERMEADTLGRNASHVWGSIPVDQEYVQALRHVESGAAKTKDMLEIVGFELAKWVRRGAIYPGSSPAEWRETARAIASAEIEALRMVAERDDGDHNVAPIAALFREAVTEQKEALSLDKLFDRYIAELKRRNGRGDGAARRWKSVFADLKAFLPHDDAHQLTRSDVMKWKAKLEASGSNLTFGARAEQLR
jgi:hypothetical protein